MADDKVRAAVARGLPYGIAAKVAALTAPSALTSAQVATANAVTPANAAYTQADQTALANLANDLKAKLNALQTDVATLRTELASIVTELQNLSLG